MSGFRRMVARVILGGVLVGSALTLALPATAVVSSPPTVTSLNPTSGATTGGVLVAIYGTGFTSGSSVLFGTNAGTGVTFVSSTTLVAYAPAGSAGVVNLTVTTPSGPSAIAPVDQFDYVVTPSFADASGHANTGISTAGVTAGISGPLSGSGAASFSGGLETEVNTADAYSSPQDFTVQGWFDTLSGQGGSIIGMTNTENGVGSTADDRMVWMDNAGHLDFAVAPGDRAQQISSTQTTTTAYNNGAWHFVVASVGPSGMQLYVDGVLVAHNAAVTTAEAYSGWWHLGFGAENLGGWTDTPADGYWTGDLADMAVFPSQLTSSQVATLDDATSGPSFASDTLTLDPTSYWPLYDTVSAMSPTSGPAAGGTSVTITGSGFVSGAAVAFGSSAGTGVVVVNPTTITVTAPPESPGTYSVSVTNPGSPAITAPGSGFTYLVAPTVTALSPATGPSVGGTAVTITGTGFVSGAAVAFGSNAGTGVVIVNATTITVRAPAGTPGSTSVTVTTSAGSGTSAPGSGFTYVVAPQTPANVSESQDGVAPDLSVVWSPSLSGSIATGALVQLYTKAGATYSFVSQIICGASCTSTIFRELTFGATYEALVYPTNAGGYGPARGSSALTLTTSCTLGACVTLNATTPIGPANHAASGILSSVYPVGQVQSDLESLNTTMFRSAPTPLIAGLYNWTSWNVATSAGAQTTLVLSDEYSAAYGGAPPTPWSNWSAYNTEITSLVSTLAASGEPINYWEVYNEPGGNDSYYSAAGYATETPALLLEQFLDTYQDIRSVLPNAAIIGPSLEEWSDYPGQYGSVSHAFDMVTFLNFAAANHLQLAAISWHEIDDSLGPIPEENTLLPAMIEDHVAEARKLIAALPALGTPMIFINEYGMPEVQSIPGWDVAYLAALTDAGVNSAGRSCWGDACANPTLDGLLRNNGVATTPDYFERLVYAAMSGTMGATTSTADTVTALGSYNAMTGTLTALVGRGVGCTQFAYCATDWPTATDAAPTSVSVTVTVPWSSGTAAISLSDFEGQTYAATSAPTPLKSSGTVVATGPGTGTITVTIPSFADGDAYGLTITAPTGS